MVYTVAGGVTYLQAFTAQELNAEAYARLKNPQDLAATPNRWQWVHVGPLAQPCDAGGARAAARSSGLAFEDFAVQQVPGAALGYQVVPFAREQRRPATGRKPDLTAYRVEAPPGRATLQPAPAGRGRPRPRRAARARWWWCRSVPGWQLVLPVLVPLVIGLSVVLWRRQQVAVCPLALGRAAPAGWPEALARGFSGIR